MTEVKEVDSGASLCVAEIQVNKPRCEDLNGIQGKF